VTAAAGENVTSPSRCWALFRCAISGMAGRSVGNKFYAHGFKSYQRQQRKLLLGRQHSTATATSAVVALTVKTFSTLAASNRPELSPTVANEPPLRTFCHWGINTFLNLEWSDGTYRATNYAPSAVNVDQWVGAAWAGGKILSAHDQAS